LRHGLTCSELVGFEVVGVVEGLPIASGFGGIGGWSVKFAAGENFAGKFAVGKCYVASIFAAESIVVEANCDAVVVDPCYEVQAYY
jgi:hypothetical protein